MVRSDWGDPISLGMRFGRISFILSLYYKKHLLKFVRKRI